MIQTCGSALLAFLFVCAPAWAHGGTYRGPSGSPTVPASPSGPSGPGTGAPGAGTGPGPSTGGAADAAGDLTAWQQWWALNRDEYLELKRALAEGDLVSRSDSFFLGPDGVVSTSPGPPAADVVRMRIVPTLIDLLAKEKSPDIATAALLALAKIGEGEGTLVSSALRSKLSSSNQEIAETAALALGVMSANSDASLLVELLHDSVAGRKLVAREEVPVRTRAFAAYALGLIGHDSKNADVRRFCVHHLALALDAEAQAPARDVPVACAMALGIVPLDPILVADSDAPTTASRAGQVAHLAKHLSDSKTSEMVRAYAPVSMARLAAREPALRAQALAGFVPELGPSSGAGSPLRQSVVNALGLLADADEDAVDVAARAALKKTTVEGDRLARRLALIALARAAARPGEHAGFDKTLDETRAFLLGELARGTTPERPWAALALGILERGVVARGGIASPAVKAALTSALQEHSSPVEAGAYATALGLMGGDVGPVLLGLLEDARDDQVRSYAAVALGIARVRAGIEPLRKLVRTARYRPGLLREASIGLGLLGDKTVSLELIELLKDAQGLSAQGSIATALGYVGDARAVDPLLAVALDTLRTNGSRAFAVVALGLICDRRPLPWNTVYAADANYWIPPTTLFDPVASAGVLDIL
ncbi:MAG: HEAT repeat domain-containing protein [Planctomycetes bacterium]|nr:HEAT repeat domain-containing protein [Planctomycetota bacterium]